MSIEKRLIGVNPVASGGEAAEGVSFDGTNDYLSRSSLMSGEANGKTFTFSTWSYNGIQISDNTTLYSNGTGGSYGIKLFYNSSYKFFVGGYNSSGTTILWGSDNTYLPRDTWNHILVSIDMTSSSNSKVYINDVDTNIIWDTFTDDSINFTKAAPAIGNLISGQQKIHGRVAHFFLDKTYRDLSTESNRRLFIDSDGKPSDTIPSNPILYLPMTDAATAGDNAGTGGDFTVNGVLDTAERGPNQYNCSASSFSSSMPRDWMDGPTISFPNTRYMTVSFTFRTPNYNSERIFYSSGRFLEVRYNYDWIVITGQSSSASVVVEMRARYGKETLGSNRFISVQAQVDSYSQSGCKIFIDGVSQTVDFNTNPSSNNMGNYSAGCEFSNDSTHAIDAEVGEFWVDGDQRDLASDNPFWDSDTNRHKSVAQVIDETGDTPLIGLPLRADDAGKNLGTSGDFTVYSGPYTGARGGSEFWARSIWINGAGNHGLSRDYLTGGADSTTVSFVMCFNDDSGSSDRTIFMSGTDSDDGLYVLHRSDGKLRIMGGDTSGGSEELMWDSSSTYASDTWHTIMASIDISDSSKRSVYVNGVEDSGTWSQYDTSATIDMSHGYCYIGKWGGSWDGLLGNIYLHQSYIDFSQETNRHKFVDQLGFPRDLTQQIEDGDVPEPLVYMPFDDWDNMGKNNGTGGDFTVTGDEWEVMLAESISFD
jgi:hypothetical protein